MRYFNASSQPYVSNFVPQDMNLIYKMQQDLVKEDEAALGAVEKASNAFNLKGGYRTGDAAKLANQQYNTEVANISNNLNTGKLKPRDAVRQISTLLNHFNTNPEVNTIKLDESLSPEVSKNLETNPGFYDSGIADAWNSENKKWKPATAGITESDLRQGYNLYNSSPYYEKQNYGEFYNQMKADLDKTLENPIYNEFRNPDGSIDTNKIINGVSIEKLEKDKAIKLATEQMKNNRAAFINTPVGRYEYKLNPNLTDQEFIEKVAAGNPGYYTRKQDIQKSGGSSHTAAPKVQTEIPIPHLDTGVFDNVNTTQDLSNLYNSLDEKGNLSKTKDIIVNPTGDYPMTAFELFDIQTVENKEYDTQRQFVDNIKQYLPNSTKGLKSDKEILDFYTKVVKQSGQVSHNSFTTEGLDSDKLTKHVMTNLSGKKIMLTGDNESKTLSTVAAKLGITEDDLRAKIKDSQVNGIKPVSSNNPGAFKVTIYDNKNIPREITVEGDKDQQNYFKEFNELMSNDNKAIIGDKITNNYYSVTRLSEGENSPQYGTVIFRLADGSTTEKEIKDKFGSIKKAEAQGHIFKKDKQGNYKLLINDPIDPTSFGRNLVQNWNYQGLKSYKDKKR